MTVGKYNGKYIYSVSLNYLHNHHNESRT